MSTDENKSTRPQTWKCRLKGWQNSMRQSIRVKKRSPQKTNSKVSDRLSPENCAGKHAQTGSSSPRRNDNKSHFGCESCNAKHGAVSDLDGRRGKVFAKPTANGQLMNEKTMIDRREVVKRTFERRKQRSNNNIIESKNSCLQQRNETAVRLNGHVKQSSTNNSQGRAEHNSRTTLHRPKSLTVLTSLFKRSSGPSRAQSINTERGNRKDSQSSEVWELKDRHSTHESTEEKFVWKCDPNYSSCESFSDSELSPRLSSKYYSLKRSKASLIYPRSPKSEWRPRKGKSRTFCCEGELRNSRKREFQSIVFQQELRNEIAREMSRSVCLLSRERRSLSDILSADDLRDYHISDREIPSRTSSVDKRRSNWSCNQKSFNDYSTRSYTSTSSIPILGVTLVDSEGNKRTINPLHHDDADYCEESLKGCKATRTDMCKTNRGIMRVRALKTTQSNPEIYRIENDPAKGVTSLPRKENSCYRYSSLDGLDDSDLDSNSLVLSDSSNTDDFIARSLSLTSRNRSLNRSTGSLEVSSDSKTTKVRKLENEHDKICQTSERDEQKVSDDVSMTIEGSQNRDIPSNLNPVRDSDRNKSRAIHGSFCNDFDVVQSSSLPSRFSGRGLMEDEPDDDVMMTPRLSSTTEDRQEWRERRRALSNDNSPKFYNYNREHKFRGQPPSVRPRIQSLEELSPMAVDEIMRKKQSVLSRARMRHSKSVPNGESPEENLREIGKRLSGNDFSLSLDSSTLSRNEELFASSDSLTSNKSTISASDMESLSSLGSAKYLSPPTTPGLNGPSNGFSRSLSVDEGSFGSPVDFDDHESLDCAPVKGTERPTRFRRKRLGKSTGDLSFDRSEELNQRRELTEELFYAFYGFTTLLTLD
ncbi:predicted protein [Nematostella vectensis]|uniref:Uncharacterized protein n=1 Tax=Nematostella vectensis TaxID=45351 RepID=A7RTF0_NEMVE|nr:predicted protein [Nematostella vectensis]|eukprot:XP_001637263.1 predicted protein [Nematostella vectensis]